MSICPLHCFYINRIVEWCSLRTETSGNEISLDGESMGIVEINPPDFRETPFLTIFQPSKLIPILIILIGNEHHATFKVLSKLRRFQTTCFGRACPAHPKPRCRYAFQGRKRNVRNLRPVDEMKRSSRPLHLASSKLS